MRYFIFIILISIIACNHKIVATDDLGKVVVSPNRSLLQLEKTGSSVLLIEKMQIEKSVSTTTSGLLQEFGGFSVATKGNKGSDPSYFNRGLSRKYIRVLVDGMDLSDVSAAGEEPTFIDYININNTDNIEILNGSQGTLYGSNAIGGVISINSATPDEMGFSQEIFSEFGSYNSIKGSNSFYYLDDNKSISLNLDGEKSSGYSSFIYDKQPLEKDGYYLYGSSLKSNLKLTDNLEITLNGRYINQFHDYDDAYASPGDSEVHYRYDKQYGVLLDVTYSQKNINHKISYQPSYTNRINVIGGRYEYDGSRKKLEYIVSTDIFKSFNILSGIEYMKIKTNIEGLPSKKEVNSLFTEFLINPLEDTILNLSFRREYDSYYDHFDTGRVQLNHNFSNNITLRSSVGSGYRAPTASQLFNKTYGNKNLKPEKSLSTDVSADIKIPNLATSFYVELFENIIEDIITAPAPTYVNQQSIESLKTKGVESRVKTDVNDKVSFGLSHSRILGKQDDGDSITLVPKDKIITSVFYQPTQSISTNVYFHYQNKAKDLKYNSLPCYKSLNVNLSYSKDQSNKIYFKIENLLDRENILNRGGTSSNDLGYKSPDRSFYFGIKLKN